MFAFEFRVCVACGNVFGRESTHGVTQAAAGDRILTFNDVLAIAQGAGLLKVQSLRAGFGRGGMVE